MQNIAAIGCIEQVFKMILQILRGFPIQLPFGFLFLALAFRSTPASLSCLLLCAGNVAYMVFQDAWSFPRTFCDYRDYQRNVPFFFPTCQSVRNAISSLSVKGGRA